MHAVLAIVSAVMGIFAATETAVDATVTDIAGDWVFVSPAAALPKADSFGPDFTQEFLDVRFDAFTKRRFRSYSFNDLHERQRIP